MPSFASLMIQYRLTPAALVAALGVSPKAVRNWRDGSRQPSPDMARAIEREFHVPRHLIRPDIWDPPPTPTETSLTTENADRSTAHG